MHLLICHTRWAANERRQAAAATLPPWASPVRGGMLGPAPQAWGREYHMRIKGGEMRR